MLMIPQLTGYPNLLSITTPVFDPLADFTLVPVDVRTIDMCVSGLQSNLHSITHFAFL